MAAEPAGGGADTGRLTIVALDGIPEVRPGDDLAGLIASAIERFLVAQPDFGPLRPPRRQNW